MVKTSGSEACKPWKTSMHGFVKQDSLHLVEHGSL